MKINTTKVTSESIKQSGLPTEFKKAIAEYIWNGFDAKATQIDIDFVNNEINSLTSLTIKDNGTGINFNELDSTFGSFLDSNKKRSFDVNQLLKGKKGKGRFSFQLFCNNASWKTVYNDPESKKNLSFEILISSESLHDFKITNNLVTKSSTGTEIIFSNFIISSELIDSEEFYEYLSDEFGWFLFLNKDFYLKVNGVKIDYKNSVIKNIENEIITLDDYEFDISFILWKNKINEKYYCYYLDNENYFIEKEHTNFNNKTSDFHHSVYVSSSFFDKFNLTENNEPTLGFSENQTNPTFKQLKVYINQLILQEQKNFIKEKKAIELIDKYNKSQIFPKFSNSPYDVLRKRDLENVVKELYCINSNIFDGLKIPQQKTIVGFLNLLLDSEQRDNILNILESIIELSEEERIEFSKVITNTSIRGLTNFIKLMESRKGTIEILNKLVYELGQFTNERDHIQKLVENNYWLFGEQYHLVSADVNFETMLNNYLSFIEGFKKDKDKLTQKDRLKRPDIFICKKNIIPDEKVDSELSIEENIIVELKRPNVIIGKEQYDQIENYIRFIVEEPKFNSKLRKWKLILVGKSVDNYIKAKYNSNENKGKKFLIESVPNDNYEIYAYTWDDINRLFDNRHKFILDAINLETNLSLDGIVSPDLLTEMTINKN